MCKTRSNHRYCVILQIKIFGTIQPNKRVSTVFHVCSFNLCLAKAFIMRDIFRFFNQTYSAVRTSDQCDRSRTRGPNDWAENGNRNPYSPTVIEPACDQDQYSSNIKSCRSLENSFSILDVFFNQPTKGRGPRWPKGEYSFK